MIRHARRLPERIQDVLEAIGNIAADTQRMTEGEFLADGKTQRAVIESLIVMGEAANRIMLHVHNHGIGECGVYTYEVAETKVTQVMDFARKHQHPLQCVMEKK